jgi:hypothetical protein
LPIIANDINYPQRGNAYAQHTPSWQPATGRSDHCNEQRVGAHPLSGPIRTNFNGTLLLAAIGEICGSPLFMYFQKYIPSQAIETTS